MSDEPAAWGVLRVGGGWVSILANKVQAETSRKSFDKTENWVHEVVALYRHPHATVRLPRQPEDFEISEAHGYAAAIEDFKQALAEAGIEWAE